MPLNGHIKWRLRQNFTNTIYNITQSSFPVGRNTSANIILQSNKASRVHSTFLLSIEGYLMVQDLKSVNGTFVNGTQISVYTMHRLFHGDIVSFGMESESMAENDKDRASFFEVIMETIRDPEKDSTLESTLELTQVDSTTDHPENNSIDIRNSPNDSVTSSKNTLKTMGQDVANSKRSSCESNGEYAQPSSTSDSTSAIEIIVLDDSLDSGDDEESKNKKPEVFEQSSNDLLNMEKEKSKLTLRHSKNKFRKQVAPSRTIQKVDATERGNTSKSVKARSRSLNSRSKVDLNKEKTVQSDSKPLFTKHSLGEIIDKIYQDQNSDQKRRKDAHISSRRKSLATHRINDSTETSKSITDSKVNEKSEHIQSSKKREQSLTNPSENIFDDDLILQLDLAINSSDNDSCLLEKVFKKEDQKYPNSDINIKLDESDEVSFKNPTKISTNLKSYRNIAAKNMTSLKNEANKQSDKSSDKPISSKKTANENALNKTVVLKMEDLNEFAFQTPSKDSHFALKESESSPETKFHNYEDNNANKIVECPCQNPSSSTSTPICKIHKASVVDHDSSFKKPFDKSFSTRDNSTIIDITDDGDDEADFSCSQIFLMSERVKIEAPDDSFQKIKNELAEMDCADEEFVHNNIPINLENEEEFYNLMPFENTQEIANYLEDDLSKNADENNKEETGVHSESRVDLEKDTLEEPIYQNEPSASRLSSEEDHIEMDQAHKVIDCLSFFGKPKYGKPLVVEPHSEQKKSIPKKDKLKKESKPKMVERNKRRLSDEAPSKKKKVKNSPKSVAEPPKCDAKTIQLQFKKRHASKMDIDKSIKENIKEERRKKLKKISEKEDNAKRNDEKYDKAKSLPKVLPESKTNRGGFLCKEPTTSNAPPTRSKTSKKEIKYKVKPVDPPEKKIEENYNLRRTKSYGDVNKEAATPSPVYEQSSPGPHNKYNLRQTAAVLPNTYPVPHTKPLPNLPPPQRVNINTQHSIPQHPMQLRDQRHALVPTNVNTVDPRLDPRRSVPLNHGNMPDQRFQVHNYDLRKSYEAIGPPANPLYPSSRLMWSNGAQNHQRAPVRRIPYYSTDDIIQKIVQWLPNWLEEQVDVDNSPPVNDLPARKIPLGFESFEKYYETFSKLILLEQWEYLYKAFRESNEQPRQVKIEHTRVVNNLLYIDCQCYFNLDEVRKHQYYKNEDFLLLECGAKNEEDQYFSLNFAFVQKCKRTEISDDDVISIRLGDLCPGEPHTKLEFTVITRYQSDKKIHSKGFLLLKLIGNIGSHLKQIRAVKGLADSNLCPRILNPRMNDCGFPVVFHDIIQPHVLNDKQKSIVLEGASLCTGHAPGIYCIKGPPGTGKSTVIVNLILQILFSHTITRKTKEPPMILLAAPSNTAVDSLLIKLTEKKRSLPPEWEKFRRQVKLVRIGPELSISEAVRDYSLNTLSNKHLGTKHKSAPGYTDIMDKKQLDRFLKSILGSQYGYHYRLCEEELLKGSNIVCTTLNSCVNGKLIEAVNRGLIRFTCCIIDEATQCHEVESLLPTMLGIEKFVMVGDPKQLNATIMNREAANLGYGQSLFSRIANNFASDPPRSPVRLLTDQYRMHKEICDFPNRQFYNGELRSFPNFPNKLPENIKPYQVFNCEKIIDSCDYTNIDEVHLIKKLLTTIFGMIDRTYQYTVGIITPYNAQKDLINKHISLLGLKENCKVTVNTVDSFQGMENDIVIISCVRDSTNSFLQNENRLNVALTRAKQALYVIGNYTLFKECRPLYDLREDAKKRKVMLDIKQDPKTIDNFSRYLLRRDNRE